MKSRVLFFTAAAVVLSAIPFWIQAQAPDKLPPELRIRHTSGDSVQPAYEGWRKNADGTVTMWFGYFNRNTEEKMNVPVGTNNKFDPPAIDRGQPAYFYPGFHQFVFQVQLPKDWDPAKKLVWTLTANGVTLTANGSMSQGYEVDDGVISMNLSPGGDTEGNKPPVVEGPDDLTAELGASVKLVANATDDGLPKPRGGRGRPGGVRMRWEEYRGPGDVNFEPANITGEYGKPVEADTEAQFSAPGIYRIRVIGFDGQREGFHEFKVTVTPAKH